MTDLSSGNDAIHDYDPSAHPLRMAEHLTRLLFSSVCPTAFQVQRDYSHKPIPLLVSKGRQAIYFLDCSSLLPPGLAHHLKVVGMM